MREMAALLCVLLLGSCAAFEPFPNPLTADEVIARATSGASSKEIIDELWRTGTLIPLSAAEIVRLHEAGVPDEVLDYLQYAQLQEIRWRDRLAQSYWYGPGFYRGFGFGPCPWPGRRPYRGGSWGC